MKTYSTVSLGQLAGLLIVLSGIIQLIFVLYPTLIMQPGLFRTMSIVHSSCLTAGGFFILLVYLLPKK